MPPANEPRQREIRVFISSTFRDIQEEREELVKRVFPQFRQLCASRRASWGEVDLGWCTTEEHEAAGIQRPLANIQFCVHDRRFLILSNCAHFSRESLEPDMGVCALGRLNESTAAPTAVVSAESGRSHIRQFRISGPKTGGLHEGCEAVEVFELMRGKSGAMLQAIIAETG